MPVPVIDKYADLNLAEGEGDGVGDSADGEFATPWDYTKALLSTPTNSVCFVKRSSSPYSVTSGMSVGNTNVRGNNHYIKFKMYHTTFDRTGLGAGQVENWLTDMEPGGFYYGSAIDAYREVEGFSKFNPDAVWGDIDGGGTLADDLLTIRTPNIELSGFNFHGTDGINPNNGIEFADSPENTVLKGCRFDDTYLHMGQGIVIGLLVSDCYFGDTFLSTAVGFQPRPVGGLIEGCIFKIRANGKGARIDTGTSMRHCVFLGGTTGVRLDVNPGSVTNCLFLNQTSEGILTNAATSTIVEYGNIFNPLGNQPLAIFMGLTKGQVAYSDYSLYWANGTQVAVPWVDDADGDNVSFAGPNVITDRDPNIDLYTLMSERPILGRPDMNGNRQPIGAVLERFPKTWRRSRRGIPNPLN